MGSFTEHFLNNRLDKGIKLFYCGHEQCPPEHGWGPGMRSHYLLHYVVRGKGTVTLPGAASALGPGDSFCVFPNVPVSYRADEQDPWEYYWVGFEGETAADCLTRSGFSERNAVVSGVDRDAVRSLFQRLLERSAGDRLADELGCAGLLLELFALYLGHAEELAGWPHRLDKRRAGREEMALAAVAFIQANYQRKLTIPMLAAHVGLERSHFTKQFQASVGVPPYEFITRYRLEQGVRLLLHTDQPVETIAYSVGFSEPSYFARRFSERFGSAPSVFRRIHR
ncbi:AraC family transcriptional regulator [Gorillibacterium sp. sgz500922]|uniref:AraC family transcriptional regulator n=1 Tax=Gorillibacterium sp. sgz500922 TaxID=3446694 RepID=UPI003F66F2A8